VFFLQVVISEALCSQDFIYTAQCNSNKAVHVDVSGKVSLMNISKVQQEITAMPKKHSGAEIAVMALWVKENNRYICFNEKWRIVGKKRVDDKCYFIEKSKGGYRHFVSAVNESKVLAFTKRGKAIGPAMKVNLKHRCDTFSTIEKSEIEFLLEKNTTTIKPQSNLSVVGKSSRSQSIEANSHKHKLKQGMHKRRHHHNQNHHRAMRSSSSSSTTTTTTTTTPPPMSSSSNSFHKSPSNILNSVLALHGVIPKKSGQQLVQDRYLDLELLPID
uniref:Fibroblast growth factor n=1 Tax=Megaselia scalaris TaxID=36166 RepID=T1GDJ4_MEGSC